MPIRTGSRTVKEVVKAQNKGGGSGGGGNNNNGSGGSKSRLTREQELAAIEKEYALSLSEEAGKEGSLTKAYNDAVKGGDQEKIAAANARWYNKQLDYAKAWNRAAGSKADESWEAEAQSAYDQSLQELNNLTKAPTPDQNDLPIPEEEPDVEQGTSSQPKVPFSERRQQLVDDDKKRQERIDGIDWALQAIERIRDTGEPIGTTEARLIANEANLKKERADLSDKREAIRRALQELGGKGPGITGRSAAPTGEGHREAIRRLWRDTGRSTRAIKSGVDTAFGLGVDRPSISGAAVGGTAHALLEPGVFSLRRAKEEHVAQAPAGHLFAPKPPGGASPEALEALRKKLVVMEKSDKARAAELKDIAPQIDTLNTKLRRGGVQVQGGGAADVLISTRAENNPDARAFRMLVDRRDKLLREARETDPAYQQVQRGISHMESVLSEQEQE